jgi:peptide-methionine (R)-S-oxide reductase
MKLLVRLALVLVIVGAGVGIYVAFLQPQGEHPPIWGTLRQAAERKPVRIGAPPGGRLEKTDDEWRAILSEEQFRVTRGQGTERAFCGAFWNAHGDGVYHCICCGQALFDSGAKYDSRTGWPSFFQPVDDNAISMYQDGGDAFGQRIEITCSRCDAHLGHVFPDGPKPTGLRYFLNSVALKFVAREASPQP